MLFILLPSISIVCTSELPDLCKIIDWNFSGLTIMLFRLNQSIAFSESFSKVVSSACFSFEIEEIVLSSAKLYISEFSSVVSRSFRNMLNKMGSLLIHLFSRVRNFVFNFLLRLGYQNFRHVLILETTFSAFSTSPERD